MADHSVIPDGWKLVPAEPTLEMIYAALDRHQGEDEQMHASIYRAMLAAAPEPPDHSVGINEMVLSKDVIERLVENAFSWAKQDCNYLPPEYAHRLVEATLAGMKPEQAAVWRATGPEIAARKAREAKHG